MCDWHGKNSESYLVEKYEKNFHAFQQFVSNPNSLAYFPILFGVNV